MQQLNSAISIIAGMPATQRGARAKAAQRLNKSKVYITKMYRQGFGRAIAYSLWEESGRAVDLKELINEGKQMMGKAA